MDDFTSEVVLSLIRDTCAIKRNIFGLFQPHSLQEFNDLLNEYHLHSLNTIYFNSADLANISSDSITQIIQQKIDTQINP